MKQLDIIKAFAELEGVRAIEVNGKMYTSYSPLPFPEDGTVEYNPITNLALNCAARDKYLVEIDYYDKIVSIYNAGEEDFIAKATVNFTDDLCQAVIQCILKSKGLWK